MKMRQGKLVLNRSGLRQDGQKFRLWTAEVRVPGFAQESFRVFVDLFRRLEILLVCPIIFVLAFIRRVLSADLRTSEVDTTAMIGLEMLAGGVDQQIPLVIFDEDSGCFMEQVPSDEIVILSRRGVVDRQRKVATAFG